jgi:acylphosphatase
MNGMVYKRIIVKGKVQGVFFRASARERAEELGLTGEVRNLRDGSVELVVAGPQDKVLQLINWCHEGPRNARVSSVEVQEAEARAFEGFKVVRG